MILGAAFKYTPPPEVEGIVRTQTGGQSDAMWQVGIVVLVALAIGVLLFLLVYLTRRNRYATGQDNVEPEKNPYQLENAASGGFRLFGKRRRKYRKHRPRNPSLADTGGLPPVREDESVNPPPA